jgi:hypothetical protein
MSEYISEGVVRAQTPLAMTVRGGRINQAADDRHCARPSSFSVQAMRQKTRGGTWCRLQLAGATVPLCRLGPMTGNFGMSRHSALAFYYASISLALHVVSVWAARQCTNMQWKVR